MFWANVGEIDPHVQPAAPGGEPRDDVVGNEPPQGDPIGVRGIARFLDYLGKCRAAPYFLSPQNMSAAQRRSAPAGP